MKPCFAGLGLTLALASSAGAASDKGPGPLPWRAEGRPPFTVDAMAVPDSSGWILDVYVRVPPEGVRFVVADALHAMGGTVQVVGEKRARLRLQVRLSNQFGARLHESSQEFTFPAQDSASSFGQVVATRFPAKPGRVRLDVRLEDLESRKRGLAYVGRKVLESAEVEGPLEIPDAEGGVRLSDLGFLWGAGGRDVPAAFVRDGMAMLPNPERLFGLYATTLKARFVADPAVQDARPWHWHARVLRGDQVMAEQESTTVLTGRLEAVTHMDLSSFPAGGYDLEVKAWREGDDRASVRRGHFSIAWQLGAWRRSPREVQDEVHLLLSEDEEERFADLEPGEQEDYVEQFWKRRDLTTGTAANEWRSTFEERVQYANEHFSYKGMEKGIFTDMGRVYVRYGPPSDVEKQVIPAGDETLLQVVQELAATEDAPLGNVRVKGFGGDLRPFEIWIYENVVPIPIEIDPERVGNLRRRERLVFLFVDEQGYGQYTLRYSTE